MNTNTHARVIKKSNTHFYKVITRTDKKTGKKVKHHTRISKEKYLKHKKSHQVGRGQTQSAARSQSVHYGGYNEYPEDVPPPRNLPQAPVSSPIPCAPNPGRAPDPFFNKKSPTLSQTISSSNSSVFHKTPENIGIKYIREGNAGIRRWGDYSSCPPFPMVRLPRRRVPVTVLSSNLGTKLRECLGNTYSHNSKNDDEIIKIFKKPNGGSECKNKRPKTV